MKSFRRNQRGVLYVFAVIVMFLVIMPIIWYVLYYNVFATLRTRANSLIISLGTNGTYQGYVDSFFTNLANYILILALIGLGLWVYVYSQRTREVSYY